MNTLKIKSISDEILVPLFSGVHPVDTILSTKDDGLVTYHKGVNKIKFKLKADSKHSFYFHRAQKFDKRTDGIVNEFRVVDAFVECMNDMSRSLSSWYTELKDAFTIRMISTALSFGNANKRDTIIALINQFDRWSRGTYEGRQHSAAIAITNEKSASGVLAKDVLHLDFYSVLSNGYDTAILCSNNGRIIGHTVVEQDYNSKAMAPYRLIPMANFASEGIIVLVLNRKGEILIFIEKQLCFARRNGKWHYLTHTPLIKQIQFPNRPRTIRESIYETCLDTSFAGSGACIGVVLDGKREELGRLIARREDILETGSMPRAIALKKIIDDRKFHEIPRPVRMELAAIDGALLLDEKGSIISVGTILNIKSGSDSGGRLAAACELSKLGIGIKVSQDGGIRGFDQFSRPATPSFSAM